MTDLNTDHLSQRERYLMSMVYSAFLGYTKDQDHAARQVNHIVKSADELEPATTPQPSADAVREVPDGMVLVQKHDLEWIVAHVLDECDGSGPCADLAARRVRALLASAPAASGEKGVGNG